MPGVAALVNKSVADDASIFLFFNTDSNNLGLGLMSGQKPGLDPKTYYNNQTSGTATTGNIIKSSPMGAAYVNGVNVVVGFTTSGSASPPTGVDVSMLSPIYQTLSTTGVDFHNAIAICSDGGTPSSTGTAWIYYLSINQEASLGTLNEYSLTDYNINNLKQLPDVANTSQLAAYYVSETYRYVIYQGTDGGLYEYEANAGNTNHIDSVAGVRTGSPLAVSYAPTDAETGTTYLYYVDTNLKIFRVTKSGGQWGSPSNMDRDIDQSSQLSVVLANRLNHLFFLPTGAEGNNFEHEVARVGGR